MAFARCGLYLFLLSRLASTIPTNFNLPGITFSTLIIINNNNLPSIKTGCLKARLRVQHYITLTIWSAILLYIFGYPSSYVAKFRCKTQNWEIIYTSSCIYESLLSILRVLNREIFVLIIYGANIGNWTSAVKFEINPLQSLSSSKKNHIKLPFASTSASTWDQIT